MATNKQFNAEGGLSVGGSLLVADSSGNLTTQTITGRNNNTNITLTPLGTGTVSVPSLNKIAFTQPANGATITIADGKTVTFNNTFTMTAVAGATIDFGNGGTIAFEGGGFIYDNVATLSNLSSVATITTGVWNATPVGIGYGGTGAALANPGADRIFFWDASANANAGGSAWLQLGNSLAITGTSFDTIQDIRTTASPTFSGLTVNGTLTVTGTSTILNTTELSVDDINITLGDTASPTDAAAAGGGITLRGTTNKTITWGSTNGWTSSEDINLASGKNFKINGAQIAASNLSNGTTGTGSVVLASAPTLTTPTLGVATATSINKVAITAPATGSTLTIAEGKTLTASNTLTFTGTDGTSFAFPTTGGTVAITSNKLSAFATTTSAELAGVISDETGSGALVFATSPSLTTPTLGVATATSINKVTITAPATSATLTIANTKTLTVNNTLTFNGTDATTFTFPTSGGTVALTSNKLSAFAATTSAELAGVISDETGSGLLVFATSPTLTTPNIGAATGSTLTLSGTTSTASPLTVSTVNTSNTAAVLGVNFNSVLTGGLSTTTMYGVANQISYNPTVAISNLYHQLNLSTLNSGASYTNVFTEYNRLDFGSAAVGGVVANYYGSIVGTPVFHASATTDITTYSGYAVENPLNSAGVTIGTIYGFYSGINSGTGTRWGIYAAGTANNAINGFLRVGGVTAPTVALDVTGTISSSGPINAAGGSLTLSSWTSANTDIDGLIGGSAAGSLIIGAASGHVTLALRDNDVNDGFQIVSGNGAFVSSYTKLAFEVKGTGNTTIGGTLNIAGATTATNITASGSVTATDFITSATSCAVANTTATTVNFAGAATTLNIGNASGTTTMAGNVSMGGTTVTMSGKLTLSGTGAMKVNVGTTAQRPANEAGLIRFNSSTVLFEGNDGTAWTSIGGATLTDDNATNASYYPVFSTQTSGVMVSAKVGSSKLTYNPSTGTLKTPFMTVFGATGGVQIETRDTGTNWIEYAAGDTLHWYKTAATAADRMTLTSAGNLTVTGSVTAFSDRRVKKDIVIIENALDRVSQLNGYTYYRSDEEGPRNIGVIAQEVKEVFPELVHGSEEDGYSVAYGNMVAVLIEAVKELKAEIAELKANR